MSKKEKDLAYYKKYVIIDLWVLLIVALVIFILPVISGIVADATLNTAGIFTVVLSSLSLLSICLTFGELVLFVVCLILTKKEHPASGILNIILAVLFLINYSNFASLLVGLIHLVNSIGYQKHLKDETKID